MTGGYSGLNTIWVMTAAVLVFSMQAGFMMLETGLTRKKNVANTALKNLMDFACGGIAFLLIGFGILYEKGNPFIGCFDFFAQNAEQYTDGIPGTALVAFSMMFCATAATIVSGAVAGRFKTKAYLFYTILLSAFIYPIAGHWIWGGGWLELLSIAGWTGFTDFAGGTIVHMVGGIAALLAAKMVGARLGKYVNGEPRVIPGHNVQSIVLGTFILWIGWFGFNAGSTLSIENNESLVCHIFMNTNVSAICAAISSVFFTQIRFNKIDVTMTLSGTLGGLVAITAGCSEVSLFSAAIIGLLAGVITIVGIEIVDRKLHIDDPVGAFAVHGVCGAFGTICVGLFAEEGGLFTTGEYGRLLVQIVGVSVVALWVFTLCGISLLLIKKFVGLRVTKEEEIKGLDWAEHGISTDYLDISSVNEYIQTNDNANVPLDEAVSVMDFTEPAIEQAEVKITKIEILTRYEKFEVLKQELSKIGITGMTVTSVLGCGIQKGSEEFYRGVASEVHLLPKIQINIVVTKVPVELVVETIRRILYTGHIGDGKIFIYDVKNVIKVRTDERGYAALQGADD